MHKFFHLLKKTTQNNIFFIHFFAINIFFVNLSLIQIKS